LNESALAIDDLAARAQILACIAQAEANAEMNDNAAAAARQALQNAIDVTDAFRRDQALVSVARAAALRWSDRSRRSAETGGRIHTVVPPSIATSAPVM
jgi:hypothetical protein